MSQALWDHTPKEYFLRRIPWLKAKFNFNKAFCYRFNRRFQLHEMVNRLAYVALRTPPMPQRLLKLAEIRW